MLCYVMKVLYSATALCILIAIVPTLSQDGYLSRHAKKEYSQSDGEKAVGYSTVSHGWSMVYTKMGYALW